MNDEYVRKDIADELVEALEEVLDGLGFLAGGDYELEGWGIPEERGKEIRAALAKYRETEPIDMLDQIEIYRLIKKAGVRKHGEIAKVIADHLSALTQETET